jgi:hypothetical protein
MKVLHLKFRQNLEGINREKLILNNEFFFINFLLLFFVNICLKYFYYVIYRFIYFFLGLVFGFGVGFWVFFGFGVGFWVFFGFGVGVGFYFAYLLLLLFF